MHGPFRDLSDGYLLVGGILAIAFLGGVVLAWLDRRTDSPVMRTRVNDASDPYLLDQGSLVHEGLKSARHCVGSHAQ